MICVVYLQYLFEHRPNAESGYRIICRFGVIIKKGHGDLSRPVILVCRDTAVENHW